MWWGKVGDGAEAGFGGEEGVDEGGKGGGCDWVGVGLKTETADGIGGFIRGQVGGGLGVGVGEVAEGEGLELEPGGGGVERGGEVEGVGAAL